MGQKSKSKLMFAATCALLCGLCVAAQASDQNLPDGKGKAEFIHNCTACHRADMVTRVKKTPDEWRKSVDDMAARGTDGTKQDLDNVVLYLDTYFSTGKPVSSAATPPPPPALRGWATGPEYLAERTHKACSGREHLPHLPPHRKTSVAIKQANEELHHCASAAVSRAIHPAR